MLTGPSDAEVSAVVKIIHTEPSLVERGVHESDLGLASKTFDSSFDPADKSVVNIC